MYVTKTKDPSALTAGTVPDTAGEDAVPMEVTTGTVTVAAAGELLSPVPVVETDSVVVLTVLVRVTMTVSPFSPELGSDMLLAKALCDLGPVPRSGDPDGEVIGGSVSVTVRGPSVLTPVTLDVAGRSDGLGAELVAIGSKDSMVVPDCGKSELVGVDVLVPPVAGEEGVRSSVDVRRVENSAREKARQ